MKHVTKYFIFIIGLLTSNLLNTYLTKYILSWLNIKTNVYLSTLAGMVCLMVIYLPLFVLSEKLMYHFSEWYFKQTSHILKSRLKSFFVGLILIFGLLFLGYMYVWYKKSII
ncbi:MAG: hypothetical protein NW207_00240 [Cytophagales bacterium]|nr:hypothetical protein [Cytophagales bacterium]